MGDGDTTKREDLPISLGEVFLVDKGLEIQNTKLLCLRTSVDYKQRGKGQGCEHWSRKKGLLSIH